MFYSSTKCICYCQNRLFLPAYCISTGMWSLKLSKLSIEKLIEKFSLMFSFWIELYKYSAEFLPYILFTSKLPLWLIDETDAKNGYFGTLITGLECCKLKLILC